MVLRLDKTKDSGTCCQRPPQLVPVVGAMGGQNVGSLRPLVVGETPLCEKGRVKDKYGDREVNVVISGDAKCKHCVYFYQPNQEEVEK